MSSFDLFAIKSKNLFPTEIEYQERCNKADDAAHAHIRQEVLGEIDARVGAHDSKGQQQQR